VYSQPRLRFNAGQAQVDEAQLRKVELLCARATDSDRAAAARLLAGVEELLRFISIES